MRHTFILLFLALTLFNLNAQVTKGFDERYQAIIDNNPELFPK